MKQMIRISGIQIRPVIGDQEANLHRCLRIIQKVAKQDAQLIVFPECVLTGYCFSSLHEAIPFTESIPGPSTNEILELCRDLQVYVVVGMLEADGHKYYNAAVLLGPEGIVGKYRKLHLPYLGIDRFLNHGDNPPAVYETAREKQMIKRPGEYEVDYISDRRPEWYSPIVNPSVGRSGIR